MCGIVGILGREPVAGLLVDALKRLEYRGYDSAGVATLESGQLVRRRAEGKLRNLEARLTREPLAGTTGIGHTRWATHGRPTESNAHPHATERLAVVHNGIIENFRELREELEKTGAKFGSGTFSRCRPSGCGCRLSCRSTFARSTASRYRLAARPITRGWWQNTGSSVLRACRSRSTSLPSSAIATCPCRQADCRFSCRSRVRPPTRSRRCATPKSTNSMRSRW